jgi:hypothetical protein
LKSHKYRFKLVQLVLLVQRARWARVLSFKIYVLSKKYSPIISSPHSGVIKRWSLRATDPVRRRGYRWKKQALFDTEEPMRTGSKDRVSTGVLNPFASMVPGVIGYPIGDMHAVHDPV